MISKQALFWLNDLFSPILTFEKKKQNKTIKGPMFSFCTWAYMFCVQSCKAVRVLAGTQWEKARVQGSGCNLSLSPHVSSVVGPFAPSVTIVCQSTAFLCPLFCHSWGGDCHLPYEQEVVMFTVPAFIILWLESLCFLECFFFFLCRQRRAEILF